MHDLLRRQNGVRVTLGRFRNKPLDWKNGNTCAHLARFHMRAMGHKPPKLPPFRSLLGAHKALAARDWSNVADMLAAHLPEIAPAAMLPGDLAVLASEDGLGSIFVAIAPHKLAGWREDVPYMIVLDIEWSEIDKAFRV